MYLESTQVTKLAILCQSRDEKTKNTRDLQKKNELQKKKKQDVVHRFFTFHMPKWK